MGGWGAGAVFCMVSPVIPPLKLQLTSPTFFRVTADIKGTSRSDKHSLWLYLWVKINFQNKCGNFWPLGFLFFLKCHSSLVWKCLLKSEPEALRTVSCLGKEENTQIKIVYRRAVSWSLCRLGTQGTPALPLIGCTDTLNSDEQGRDNGRTAHFSAILYGLITLFQAPGFM